MSDLFWWGLFMLGLAAALWLACRALLKGVEKTLRDSRETLDEARSLLDLSRETRALGELALAEAKILNAAEGEQ